MSSVLPDDRMHTVTNGRGVARIRPTFGGYVVMDGTDMAGIETVEGSVIKLHALSDNLKNLRRLLDRKGEDGSTLSVEPALVEAVIAAGREEMQDVRERLAMMLDHPANAQGNAAGALIGITTKVDAMLDALAGSVHLLKT